MANTVLKKDKTVNVKTKTGGSYSYAYSTLAEIHRYLEESHQRYKAYIKNVDGNDYMFIKQFDEDGKLIDELQGAKIPPVQGVQDYGGVLTSVRRFSLLMAYGLACEDEATTKARDLEEVKDKWKAMHTPSPNKPASENKSRPSERYAPERGKAFKK